MPARVPAAWRTRLSQTQLVCDLAEDIGTRRWWRGLGTMGVLGIAALAFWPDFSPLEAAPAVRGNDQLRALALAPLARPLTRTGLAQGPHLSAASAATERQSVALTATFAAGDSFAGMLERAGLGQGDAAAAAGLVAGATPLAEIAPGTRVALTLGARSAPGEPRRLERLAFAAGIDQSLTLTRGAGGLALTTTALAVDSAPLRIRGTVGESLYRSARAAGAPPAALQQYLEALGGVVSLDGGEILPGDSFDIVMSARRAGSGIAVGDVIYAGLLRGDKPVAELLRWGKEHKLTSAGGLAQPAQTITVTRGGEALGGGMGWPVAGRITSQFGRRFHPILGYARMHAGVDFGAAWGTPIRATMDGTVAFAGRHGGHGNFVRLDHGGGLGTGYAHMSSFAVWPGERVQTGQVIGYVGSTGLSTGPHLHYEMYRSGQTVNPLGGFGGFSPVVTTVTTLAPAIDPADLKAFNARLAEVKALRIADTAGARPPLALR